jgi:hypothetical protein
LKISEISSSDILYASSLSAITIARRALLQMSHKFPRQSILLVDVSPLSILFGVFHFNFYFKLKPCKTFCCDHNLCKVNISFLILFPYL